MLAGRLPALVEVARGVPVQCDAVATVGPAAPAAASP